MFYEFIQVILKLRGFRRVFIYIQGENVGESDWVKDTCIHEAVKVLEG